VRARDRWQDGDTVDMHAEMMRVTLAIVGQTLFDADVDGDAEEVGRALEDTLSSFSLSMLPLGEWLERIPLPATGRLMRGRVTLDRTIYRLIAEHRASGEDRGDLLSMLMRDGYRRRRHRHVGRASARRGAHDLPRRP
jgi:cytochrome P450